MSGRGSAVTRLSLPMLLMAGVLMAGTSGVHAQEGASMREELDALVTGGVPGSPPLAGLQVLVIQDGDVVYEYAGGFSRLDETGPVPMDLERKPRIASISKLVVAIGLMKLVEDGRVDLDSDVSTYLGFELRNPAFPDRPITLRTVLSHTSSIRDGAYYWLESGERFEDFFREGSEHWDGGAHFASGEGMPPGRYFEYANLNFGVVAAVIERVTGLRFDRYMREEVLEPLGLLASYNVCDLSEKHLEKIATLYRKRDEDEVWRPDGDWVPQLDDGRFSCHYGREAVVAGQAPGPILPGYVPGENPTLFSPQGGLRASARDLSVIARMLLNGGRLDGRDLLGTASVTEMFSPQWTYDEDLDNGSPAEGEPGDTEARRLFSAFGLSVHIVDTAGWGLPGTPRILYGHLGEAYGLIGQFWLDPENGDALISLVTGTGDDPDRFPGSSPLYRPSEEITRWWQRHFSR